MVDSFLCGGDEAKLYLSSHSFRDIFACLRIRTSKSVPISPSCGLGILTSISPRDMNKCFPPENGPSNPSSRRRLISLVRETGPIFTTLSKERVNVVFSCRRDDLFFTNFQE